MREVFGLKVDRRVVELKKALSLKIPSTKWIVTANLSSLLETVNWTLLAEGYKRIRCRSGKNIDEVVDRVIEVFKKMAV